MSLHRIKKGLFQELDVLFAAAATDELAGDTEAYRKKLNTISQVAEALGITTEIIEISINLKPEVSEA